VQPSDLSLLRTLDDPHVHPDGRRVVFTVSRPDLDEDHYDSRLWLWDGDQARSFTHGPHDSRPRWSPDGTRLAFLRREPEEDASPQLAVMAADGGEARVVTDLALGVAEAEWSPDGRRLAVVANEWVDTLAELDADERRRRPRRITRLPYRMDGEGYVADNRANLHLVDPDTCERTRLTDGDHHDGSLAWRPDGTAVAFVSARHDNPGIDGANQPFEVDVATRELTALQPLGEWDWVGYDPDGRVVLTGLRQVADWPGTPGMWRLEDGEPVDLVPGLDRSTSVGVTPAGPQRVDGGWLVPIADRGTQRVVGVADDGTRHEVAGDPDHVVTGLAAGPGVRPDGTGGLLVAVVATGTDPGELARVDPDGTTTTVTTCNETIRAEGGIRPVERFAFEHDGVEIDAWAVLPAGEGPWPVLLNVHGGPTSQYTSAFFDEFQVYASAGYLVVGANPRGSSGRGEDWARAVRGVWHTADPVDLRDLRAVVDATLDRYPAADGDRLGIMGGSYGGYATARIIAVDHRFRSAVVERGLLAWESFGGTSDIGPYFDTLFLDATLPDGWQRHRAASPLHLAADVRTPTLVVHSEQDWRCPVGQGEEYFVALLRAGVETEMLRFPEEGHELSRSGAPKHRVERFEAILDWHARHV
jgi:dipeptidyl aminopeptidase/acylaminoacyl peptidase